MGTPGDKGDVDAGPTDLLASRHRRPPRPLLRGIVILLVGLVVGGALPPITSYVHGRLITCPSVADLPGGALATDLPVLTSSDVALRSASFRVDTTASPPVVTRAGQMTGELPSGKHLWIVEQPRQDTYDSTAQHNAGTGFLYPVGVVVPDNNGCWSMTNTLGYAQILGITFVDYVVLVDDNTNADYAYGETGSPANDLHARGADIVTTITIPTAR